MRVVVYFFLFFKQNTAYEMRNSDWSSDVCSSDLRLGLRARIARHLAEQFGRGHRVDVVAACEGVAQRGHVGHVRREPQLDLRIIGGDDDVARFRHEGVADLAADLGADRDVLEVRVRSEEHTSELQSLMRISYADFCLQKKNNSLTNTTELYVR